MAINQITTANTFQQWLIATQSIISVANNLTDGGASSTFYSNTNFSVANNVTIGGNLTVSGNIILDAINFDDINSNGSASFANNLTADRMCKYDVKVYHSSIQDLQTILRGNIQVLSNVSQIT
jgi:hypothetical protein